MRHTYQKDLLEQAIVKQKDFFTVEDMHSAVKAEGVSLATTYRFLNHRVEQGVLHPYVCHGKHVYSLHTKSHCHFVCEHTGKTKHFELRDISVLEGLVPGTIDSVQLEVRGTCTECEVNTTC